MAEDDLDMDQILQLAAEEEEHCYHFEKQKKERDEEENLLRLERERKEALSKLKALRSKRQSLETLLASPPSGAPE